MEDRERQLRSKIWSNELAAGIGTCSTTISFANNDDVVIDSGSAMIALDQTNTIVKVVNYGNGKTWIIDLVDITKISYQTVV